jgi:chromosomal replication initiation ATPase DnaA
VSAPRQYLLPFEVVPAYGRDDFLVGEANRAAFELVERFPAWPSPAHLLIGPEGSGKSHLAAIFAETSGAPIIPAAEISMARLAELQTFPALVIEDADRGARDEPALFHLINRARDQAIALLITARSAPTFWGLATPDLLSRLRAMPQLTLGEPEDSLLSALYIKLFSDRQLSVKPALIRFMLQRSTRSYSAAKALVERIDQEAMARQRAPTRTLVAELLQISKTER